MGVGASLYTSDVVVKSSRPLSHLLMSCLLYVLVLIHISGTAEARVCKFLYTCRLHQSLVGMTNYSQMGVFRVT